MSGINQFINKIPQEAQPFGDGGEHLEAELELLDLKIERLVILKRAIDTAPSLEHLKGLVLFQEEVEQLLQGNEELAFDRTDVLEQEKRIASMEQYITRRLVRSEQEGIFLPLPYLMSLYGLSDFEKMLVITVLAADLHRKYEKLFAFLQDDVTSKRPTLDLVMKLCGFSEQERYRLRDRLIESAPLKKYLLVSEHNISSVPTAPFLSQAYQLDERVIRFLLGSQQIDSRLAPFSVLLPVRDSIAPLNYQQDIQQRLRQFFMGIQEREADTSSSVFIHIWGQAGSGKKLQVQQLCHYLGKSLLLVDGRQLIEQTLSLERFIDIVQRECSLQQAILCVEHLEPLAAGQNREAESEEKGKPQNALWAALKSFQGTVFLLAEKQLKPIQLIKRHTFIDLPISTPVELERKKLWEEILAGYTIVPKLDIGSLASKFRLTYGQMLDAFKTAQEISSWHNPVEHHGQTLRVTELYEACYRQIEHHLDKKATRIQPKYTWADLILPDEQKTELRNACNQMKYRHIVYGQWGFDEKLAYGKGLSLLFTGPPGTGKTMSAQIIARELDLQIYKIDLSQVISKYIGETEKNLQEIFNEAQYSHAILFFDEADALFGKRSEVKDAHDKYANVETSYLLQKMEEYEGISILASNYLQNIDEAFMRRINFIIKYPFPDRAHRQQLWSSLFPQAAPLSIDVDQSFLAEKLELTGGQIKNIVVASAFLAAEQGEAIGMKHIWKAAKHEIQKSGKIFLKHELGVYDVE